MQAQESAAALVMEQPVMDTEAMAVAATSPDALLPVLLPNVGGEAAIDGADAVRSDEVRGLLAAIRRLESIVEEETVALTTRKKIDFDDFSARQSRSMLEFVRLRRARMHLGDLERGSAAVRRIPGCLPER